MVTKKRTSEDLFAQFPQIAYRAKKNPEALLRALSRMEKKVPELGLNVLALKLFWGLLDVGSHSDEEVAFVFNIKRHEARRLREHAERLLANKPGWWKVGKDDW